MRRTVFAAGLRTVVAALVALTACTPDGDLVVGPVTVTARVGEASFLQTLFVLRGDATVTHRQRFCDLPSEEELEDEVLQVADFDISRFVQLHRLELVNTTLTATSGDFNFMTGMTVRFVPQPGAGPAVVLGTASNPNGFGSQIVLTPVADVDLLELIRANDAAGDDDCPKLEYEITFKSIPLSDVEYTVDVTVDGYAELGAAKLLTEL